MKDLVPFLAGCHTVVQSERTSETLILWTITCTLLVVACLVATVDWLMVIWRVDYYVHVYYI